MTDAFAQSPSLKRKFFDPCLVMRPQRGSTMGRVTAWKEGDPFDDIEIDFRGRTLKAKAAHPEIKLGQLVNVFEYPEGIFWGTCLQPSWYLQPLEDLIKNKRPSQAALNYLMRKNPKYWPALIRIDKRGQQDDGDDDGGSGDDGAPNPGNPNDPLNPQGFDSWDTNGDGFIDRSEWPFDPDLFDAWDLNGDGRISVDEWHQRGTAFPFDPRPFDNSWFFFIEHATTGTVPASFVLQTSNGGARSNLAGSYLAGITPLNQAPYFGYSYLSPTAFTQDLGNGRSRTFVHGVYGGVNTASLTAITMHADGGQVGTSDPEDPIYLDNKAGIIAAAAAISNQYNLAQQILVVRNVTEYSSFALIYYSTSEMGSNYLAEECVAYASSARFTF